MSDRFALPPDVGDAIRIARVLCITLMMLVHIWPWSGNLLAANVGPLLHGVYFILVDQVARASVPLLSIISGFLFFHSAAHTSAWAVIAGKARTLLIPMVAWSAAMLVIQLSWAVFRQVDTGFLHVSWLTWANRLFAITGPPANAPLGFLRDIFVCCVVALALRSVSGRRPMVSAIALGTAAVFESLTDGVFLLRPQIIVLFAAGYAIAVARPRVFVLPWWLVAAMLAVDLAVRVTAPLSAAGPLADLFHRTSVALVMWHVAMRVVRPSRLAPFILRLEPLIFVVFCSHMPIAIVMGRVLDGSGLLITDWYFPAVFLAQIPVIMVAAAGLQRIGQWLAPDVFALVTAGRFRPPGRRPASPSS